MRQEGMTYVAIGKQLGCSGANAKRLVLRAMHETAEAQRWGSLYQLPTRIRNALSRRGLESADAVLAALAQNKIHFGDDVGPHTIRELVSWARRLPGYHKTPTDAQIAKNYECYLAARDLKSLVDSVMVAVDRLAKAVAVLEHQSGGQMVFAHGEQLREQLMAIRQKIPRTRRVAQEPRPRFRWP